MNAPIVIINAGAVTPVGLSLAETAASARSRVARLRAIEWRDRRFDPFVVGSVPDDGLPALNPELHKLHLQYRESRMLRLAHLALAETLQNLPGKDKVPLLLGLPELHTRKPLHPQAFLSRLAAQSELPIDAGKSLAAARGRASALMGLPQARQRLEQGDSEFVVIGGVDCQVDLHILGTLDLQERIRNDRNSDGFSPSEGAAFVLLTRADTAARYQLPIMATIHGASIGKESGHVYSDEPYLGEGLAECVARLLAERQDVTPINTVYCSFNGERYWAREFGVTHLRNSSAFAPELKMEHPAECFGDLGAAHGAALLALSAHGLKERYRTGPVLSYASSDFGDRAATLLSSPA